MKPNTIPEKCWVWFLSTQPTSSTNSTEYLTPLPVGINFPLWFQEKGFSNNVCPCTIVKPNTIPEKCWVWLLSTQPTSSTNSTEYLTPLPVGINFPLWFQEKGFSNNVCPCRTIVKPNSIPEKCWVSFLSTQPTNYTNSTEELTPLSPGINFPLSFQGRGFSIMSALVRHHT